MATTMEGDDITVHQEDYDLIEDTTGNDDTKGNVRVPGRSGTSTGNATGSAAASAAGSVADTTNFNLRVEQNKIPEFFGTKSKGTISAMDFIWQLEDLANTNRSPNAQTYYHFANSLCNPAREWLSSMVDMDDDKQDWYLWSDFKDLFKQEYAVQTNERLILEGLSTWPWSQQRLWTESSPELPEQYGSSWRASKTFEAWFLHNNCNAGISNHAFRTFMRQQKAMMFNFFKMILFKAALTPELRVVVAQQEPETMTIKKMYWVTTMAQGEGKTLASVNKIREVSANMDDNKNDVAVFSWQGARPKTGQPNSQNNCNYPNNRGSQQSSRFNRRGGANRGNNANQNNKYCCFCKQQGHRQEECRKRIKENKPCRDSQGRAYWPSIYLKDENQDAKSVNTIDFPEDEHLEDKDEDFDMAGVNLRNRESKTRTAAKPQLRTDMGFQ